MEDAEVLMRSVIVRRMIALLVFSVQTPVLSNLPGQSSQTAARFHPDRWPKEDLDRYLALENERPKPQPATVSSKAMIAGTTNPFAVHAGLEVLKHGGKAVDAALTTSLAQIALNAGGAVRSLIVAKDFTTGVVFSKRYAVIGE
jgi:hypothetical protein